MGLRAPNLRTDSENPAKHPSKWLARHLFHALIIFGQELSGFGNLALVIELSQTQSRQIEFHIQNLTKIKEILSDFLSLRNHRVKEEK